VVDCCEHGDEPLGSGTTELVCWLVSQSSRQAGSRSVSQPVSH
jgi:hypothetical protein